VTKAVYPETEASGFKTEAESVAFGTKAKTEAVDPETEAARQYINNLSSKFKT